MMEASPRKVRRSYLKNKLKSKRTGGVTQVLQYLPSKRGGLEFKPQYGMHTHKVSRLSRVPL
jgi:hypothetical protein